MGECDLDLIRVGAHERAMYGTRAMPDLDFELVTHMERRHEPVYLARNDAAAGQLVVWTDDDLARCRPDFHHVHRFGEPTGESAALADGESRESIVLADDGTIASDECAAAQGRRIAAKLTRDHLRVIAVRHEADVLALRLLGDELETELVRHGARLGLGLRTDGQHHARENRAADAPQE